MCDPGDDNDVALPQESAGLTDASSNPVGNGSLNGVGPVGVNKDDDADCSINREESKAAPSCRTPARAHLLHSTFSCCWGGELVRSAGARGCSRVRLTLRVLRAFTCFAQADFFPLHFSGVAGDKARAA